MYLTGDELAELTARKRRRAQAEELRALGIPFRTRRDGSIVVLRVAVELALGAARKPEKRPEPQMNL